MSISQQSREALARLFSDRATLEAIDDLKADLTKKATSSKGDAQTRQKNLDMLWGIEALVVKVRANVEQSKEDQAE